MDHSEPSSTASTKAATASAATTATTESTTASAAATATTAAATSSAAATAASLWSWLITHEELFWTKPLWWSKDLVTFLESLVEGGISSFHVKVNLVKWAQNFNNLTDLVALSIIAECLSKWNTFVSS